MQRTNPLNNFRTIWNEIHHKQYKVAQEKLDAIPSELRNDVWFDANARCLLETHQVHTALSYLSKMKNSTISSLICAARCYQALGEYDLALAKYNQALIKHHKSHPQMSNINLVLSLSRCYMEMHKYKMALDTLANALPKNDEERKKILLCRAYIFHEMGLSRHALADYQFVFQLFRNDIQALSSLAFTHKALGDFQTAIFVYGLIRMQFIRKKNIDDKTPAYYAVGLGDCYQKMGHNHEAIEVYQTNPTWQNNKQILLGIAQSFEACGDDINAEYYYQCLQNTFPHYADASYYYCNYLRKTRPSQFHDSLEEALQKFPACTKLHLLKAHDLYENNDIATAFNNLVQLVNKFPYCAEAYLELIRYSFTLNDLGSANQYIYYCYATFEGHNQLFFEIEQIKQNIMLNSLQLAYYTHQQTNTNAATLSKLDEGIKQNAPEAPLSPQEVAEEERKLSSSPYRSFFRDHSYSPEKLPKTTRAALDLADNSIFSRRVVKSRHPVLECADLKMMTALDLAEVAVKNRIR